VQSFPKITVITVVFNGRQFIERTILSVIGQTYPNLEYILIDGGSTDGTIDVIKKYEFSITYWISQLDSGIYDAMNKGLAIATGKWVNFMNAGDVFSSSETVSQLFAECDRGATVLYGAVEIVYPDFSRIEAPGPPERLWRGMQFSHQAAFVELSYHQRHLFDASNRTAADLQFFYQAHRAGRAFCCVNQVVARVITGGRSESNRIETILDSLEAICMGQKRPFIHLYFYCRICSSILRSIAKRCLPRSVVNKLIQLK
jgi:glycosyltransferase involved in cell wall biosynthesis